ncbi:MAG: MBL fold metallo-hydrolase [Bacillota bacterium]
MNIPELTITVLSENTVGSTMGLTGEWGLSLLVETAGKKILFDTGERGNLVANAKALKIDLGSVDALVVSHGHYDHTGGMAAFLNLRGRLPVYAHPGLFALHHSSPDNPRYIGIPFNRGELEKMGAEFILTKDPAEIFKGIWLSGEIPRINCLNPCCIK